MASRIAISGASGLIGTALTRALRADGVTVLRIGRDPRADVRISASLDAIDEHALQSADAIVHLAGAPIARRWTRARRQEILDSRVRFTSLIARTIANGLPTRALVSASAIGYYGNRGDEWLTELSAPGSGFLADVVRAWEDATTVAASARTRVVTLRTGIVLDRAGGALREMLLPFQLGVGGPVASGRQWMSWISLHDHVRAIRFAIDAPLSGPVNAVAPNPVTNASFARAFGAALKRPALLPLPGIALRALFGQMAVETLLASQRVRPVVLAGAGFTFDDSTIEAALRRALGVSHSPR